MRTTRSTAASKLVINKVLIVGGGNAAHALAALTGHMGFTFSMLASFKDEAARINSALAEHGCITATFDAHNSPSGEIKGVPDLVSKDAADVVGGCNVIFLPLPSFAYRSALEDLKPHLRPGMHIAVTPGQGGFDYVARDVLGSLVDELVIFAILPMPFNCRITSFGSAVAVQEFKRHYRVAVMPSSATPSALSVCEQLLGPAESIGHFLAATLYPINAIIHPQRLWALANPADGDPWSLSHPLKNNPLFYEEMDDLSIEMMNKVRVQRRAGQGLESASQTRPFPLCFPGERRTHRRRQGTPRQGHRYRHTPHLRLPRQVCTFPVALGVEEGTLFTAHVGGMDGRAGVQRQGGQLEELLLPERCVQGLPLPIQAEVRPDARGVGNRALLTLVALPAELTSPAGTRTLRIATSLKIFRTACASTRAWPTLPAWPRRPWTPS